MNARKNDQCAMTSNTDPNTTAEMALLYRNIVFTAEKMVNKGVVDVEENESWARLKIHAVPLIRYMWKGREWKQKMRAEFGAENKGIVIPTQVRWPSIPCTLRERRQNGEIATSSLVFVVTGSKVAHSLVLKVIKVAGVWYQVETYTNE